MEMLLKTKLNNMSGRSMLKMFAVCPALVITTTLTRALCISLAMAIVLIISETTVSVFKKIVPVKLRGLVYIMVCAFTASLTELVFEIFMPLAAKSLGVYLPILAVSSTVLMRVETSAAKSLVTASLVDALVCSGVFALIMSVVGFIRELLGAGTIFAAPDASGGFTVFSSAPLPILSSTAGVLMTAAAAGALMKYLKIRKAKKVAEALDMMQGEM